jgi:hypothetical protein
VGPVDDGQGTDVTAAVAVDEVEGEAAVVVEGLGAGAEVLEPVELVVVVVLDVEELPQAASDTMAATVTTAIIEVRRARPFAGLVSVPPCIRPSFD